MISLKFTKHSIRRMTSRNITHREVDICLSYGEVIYKTGVRYHVISKKVLNSWNLPERLNGLCVILSRDQCIITTFKNKEIYSYTRRLSKNNLKKFYA